MITLRNYQQAAIDATYSYFMAHSGNPLIVMPTGTGKSVVIGEFVRGAIEHYPRTRVLILTHVKELIEQNFRHLILLWPEAPAGIYSAGLGRRDLHSQILFAGIQSIFKRADLLKAFDLILVDEAHLIPRNAATMYGTFLAAMKAANPDIKIIGYTATPYRLDSGMLHKGKDALFDDIAYEYPLKQAIEEGYLCEPRPKAMETTLDVSGVHRRGGEFIAGELEAAVNVDHLTDGAVKEMLALGANRGSWLVFCSGVAHARAVAKAIDAAGIECETVTGDTPSAERARILAAFKAGKLRALTNANVLTTGFDAPGVDMIALMRPTDSTGLHVQMIGRGLRLAEGKEDCLVLDFAGNVARHGPLDALRVKESKEGDGEGEAPVKVCPDCQEIVHAAVRLCPACGHEFPAPEIKIRQTAATDAILTSQIKPMWLDVSAVTYHRHEKPGKPPSMRVEYQCGIMSHREWVCFEHSGYPKTKAITWWLKRMPGVPPPPSVEAAVAWAHNLPVPKRICVKPVGKYTEITGVEF